MIRLLHTSDWHLGLETSGHERLSEQALFLDWLLETCESEAVDALLVSGDVYDVVNPSVAAQSLFANFLVRLRGRLPRCQVVVIAGNHDSGSRLEIPRPFGLALGDIHLVGSFQAGEPARHGILLRDGQGRAAAWCVAIPFLRSSDLDCRTSEGETPQDAFVRSLKAAYASLVKFCRDGDPKLPLVAMGHLTLANSEHTGSERRLIGGVESVPVEALADGAEYVALGHIHRAQSWKNGAVRYPGSPIPIDFDERHGRQRVIVVELETVGTTPVTREIDVPRPVPLLRIPEVPGTWDEAEEALRSFDDAPWKGHATGLTPLVEVRYLSTGPIPDLRERTEALCKGRAFRLSGTPRAVATAAAEDGICPMPAHVDLLEKDAPLEILQRHYRSRYGDSLPDDLRQCFDEVLSQVATGAEP